MRRLTYLLLIVCTATAIQGCIGVTRTKFSQATVPDGAAKISDAGVLDLGELDLAVKARNYRTGLVLFGPVVPIIPLPIDITSVADNPHNFFIVELYLNPEKKRCPTRGLGIPRKDRDNNCDRTRDALRTVCPECLFEDPVFSFDPASVTLRTDDGKSYSPVGYLGPSRPPYEVWRYYIAWYCGNDWPSDEGSFQKPTGPIDFSRRSCFALKFDMNPPPPDQGFVLSIDGIKKAGADFPVPPIHFEMGTRWESESVP
ncbi:MAG: hypothetical protein C3F12_00510 [Candidatus Methylomirabilota bacterium]|nr:hypothetical protein [candidate division NC10 bacterium]PWB49016.1 MAG: hypothetical protein C3F12_00510 [candidate division NC10 bacterium]